MQLLPRVHSIDVSLKKKGVACCLGFRVLLLGVDCSFTRADADLEHADDCGYQSMQVAC